MGVKERREVETPEALVKQSRLWHQMTSEPEWAVRPFPLVTRAEGSFFWDENGRRLIDGNSGLQNVHIGHGRPEMADAAAAQIRRLDYFPVYNGSHDMAERLADELHRLLPGYHRFYLLNSGSEAVELALKLLAEYWRLRGEPNRTVVLGRKGSYHGATLGALAPTGIPALRDPFSSLLIEARHISNPIAVEGESEDEAVARLAMELVSTIEEVGPERILGLFAEPVQLWDVPVPPPAYWSELRRICDAYGVPVAADEVITGFGRTGRWFGLDHWDVAADVIVLGKGLASGYAPISAVGVSRPICDAFDERPGEFLNHISTTSGHPVSCALALENIRILSEESLPSMASRSGERLRTLLEQAFGARPYVKGIRGIGLLNSVQLEMGNQGSSGRAAQNAALRGTLLRSGAYLRVDGQIWFIPPLPTEASTLEELVGIAADATEKWVSEGGR
jgi:adenosylmethionine-8-amino-7-oxononanoate aminotransferase